MPGDATPCGEVVQEVPVAVLEEVLLSGSLHVLFDLVKVERHGVEQDPHRVGGCEADLFPGQLFVPGFVVGNEPGLHGLEGIVIREGNVREVKNGLQCISHL